MVSAFAIISSSVTKLGKPAMSQSKAPGVRKKAPGCVSSLGDFEFPVWPASSLEFYRKWNAE